MIEVGGSLAAPLISVVVPAYNAASFLGATLASIRAQTERRWECVVVDDGSDDDTAAIADAVANDDQRLRVLRQSNRGPSAARNAGFRAAQPSSRFVTFMDADDLWIPEALETLLRAADTGPGTIGSHGLAEFIDEHGCPLYPGRYAAHGRARLARVGRRLSVLPPDRPTDYDVLINGNVLFPPGLLLVQRSAYEAVGPFDESFTAGEDWDMLIRLSRLGAIAFVDEVLLHYRRHGSNLGGDAGDDVAGQAWRVRCKAFHSSENSPAQRRAARLGWRAYQVHLAEKAWADARGRVRRGDPHALRELARVVVCGGRYVRGGPRPRVTDPAEPLRW